MQVSNPEESVSSEVKEVENPETAKEKGLVCARPSLDFGNDSVLDVSGKDLEFSLLEDADESVEELYMYKNAFNLIPRGLGKFRQLKTLKFFANEINFSAVEFGNLVELERLQVKVSSPTLGGLPLHKLKALKELDLSKAPPRATTLPILSDITSLKCLTKLSLCHFAIRYLPPEIGCLCNMEHLDLSFNKIKRLPLEISYLSSLVSLKVGNNKLVELPAGLSSLQRLEHLDLSTNRLTSLGSLDLTSMYNLRVLNIQYNRLASCFQVPSWLHCNTDGNSGDLCNDDFASSSVDMDVYEALDQEFDRSSCNGSLNTSSCHLTGSSLNGRCLASRKLGKDLKHRYRLQQRARQERLNSSRKWSREDRVEILTKKINCETETVTSVSSGSLQDVAPIKHRSDDSNQKNPREIESGNFSSCIDNDGVPKEGSSEEDNSCIVVESAASSTKGNDENREHDAVSPPALLTDSVLDGSSDSVSKTTPKPKRHSDKDLANPKPTKFRRPPDDQQNLSCKYSNLSFCSTDDHLPDGFYDAGRDRPYMPLRSYEEDVHLDSREVILVDRDRDEELDAIALSAQALMFQLKKLSNLNNERDDAALDNLQIASLLALFVSDNFGGSDRTAIIEKARKSVSGSNYRKPFVCSCPTGNSITASVGQNANYVEDIFLRDLCEKSLRSIKARRNSNVVPIGSLHFGVCRHRAVLLKYLCDRMDPPVPCELVRGYLDFTPHAWNVVLIKRGDEWVRMVVDACRPHDIREETDNEYFCRYVPLSRIDEPLKLGRDAALDRSFPSVSSYEEIEKAASSSLMRCKLGSVEAAAKVRTLEVCETAVEEIKNFEYTCLGEVRILGALKKHPCIVEILGHQISTKPVSPLDGTAKRRVSESVILMEYIKGGSLKSYIDDQFKAGKKSLPADMALYIARDVACAMLELHSKHIIHRDIKCENVLIDSTKGTDGGTPIVKLCDFDRAVPLRSFLHTCCIAHVGIPPPDVCVGTPRWMAPEVLRAMHVREAYGLEVDIWSFGCLLLELMTLQIPFLGLADSEIHDRLQMGERPPLTDELELLRSVDEPAMAESSTELNLSPVDLATFRFLTDVFYQCTESKPSDRLTAENLYDMLNARASALSSSKVDGH